MLGVLFVEIVNAYLNDSKQTIRDYHIKIEQKQLFDVVAVYFDGFSETPLDLDFGAAIEFKLDGVESWMANWRQKEFWCSTKFGTALSDVPPDTQGFIYKKTDGTYGVILPVVSEQYKCILKGTEEGTIQARMFSWYERMNSCKALAFMYAEGDDPYQLMKRCVKAALKLLNNGCRCIEERRYPEIFEYLGWCSWDAFQIRVNEEDILKKCQEFKDKDIPVKWAIIDDMWGEVHNFYDAKYKTRSEMFDLMHASKLYSFKADPKRFPNGLKTCIEKVNDYGIKVGMWHPTTGYWCGIDPDGEIYKELKDSLIQTQQGWFIPTYEQNKAYAFYNAYHDYLRNSGAEFVKIDNQSMTRRFYKKLAPVGEVARQFHNAIEASVGQHFDNQLINCMGMASEDMWNRSVSPISRCSDDFQPEDREWFAKHILQCSYNTIVQGQFYYCDWDMWWTDDGQAAKNSILRAISGGPIYVSDTLDRSRAEVLKPLVLENGKILRPDRQACPTLDCLTIDPQTSGKIFKLQNIANGSGVLAVFNIDAENNSVSGTISPSDIDGLVGDEFAVYEHFSQEVRILNNDESFEIKLDNNDEFKLYIIAPLVNGSGVIGRTDKFISPKTVSFNRKGKYEIVEDGPYATIENRKLVFYQSNDLSKERG